MFEIILGAVLVGIGGIIVYIARYLMQKILPGFANESGILIAKLIGLALVVLGAFIIFFVGAGEYR